MTTPTPSNDELRALLADLHDLHKQAITERSHYYVASVVTRCIINLTAAEKRIAALTDALAETRRALEPFAKQIVAVECTTDHPYADHENWPVDPDLFVTIGSLRRARSALARIDALTARDRS